MNYNFKYKIKSEISYDILNDFNNVEFPDWIYNSYYGKVFIAWLYNLKEVWTQRYNSLLYLYFNFEYPNVLIYAEGSTSIIELNKYRLIDNILYQKVNTKNRKK